jgi:hypothetical protein
MNIEGTLVIGRYEAFLGKVPGRSCEKPRLNAQAREKNSLPDV